MGEQPTAGYRDEQFDELLALGARVKRRDILGVLLLIVGIVSRCPQECKDTCRNG